MKSIYFRNFMATALMVAVLLLVVALLCVGIGRGYVITEYRSGMETGAREIARSAAAIAQTDSLSGWNLRMNVSSVARSTGDLIFISDENGLIVNCSDPHPMCVHMGQQVPQEYLRRADSGIDDELTDLGEIFGSRRYVVIVPIQDAARCETLGYVYVSSEIDTMLGPWSTFLSISAMIAMVVFVLALLVSLLYFRAMARPLDEIAAASRKFARGDFSVRVRQSHDPTDEMGALIESFNKMADSLEQAEKRRSEFIANISHELRTPMTTIAGFADGILDGTIPPEDQDKYLISIRDETRRLSRLVKGMLSTAQTSAHASDPSRRTVFDLSELMLQTLLSFESAASKKQLDVDPQLPDNPILVRADKDAITQVVYNLLDNAVKFAAPGSCLTLRLYKDGKKAYVSVKDRGETIPAEDLPFIFDRFHKSDRSRSLDKEGVGLGLYLVKSILNSHDEDIAVRSEDGVTEFVFTLPLAENDKKDRDRV